jgi:hypothetical protein
VLKVRGFEVLHIIDEQPAKEHPWTGAAHVVDGVLSYAAPGAIGDLFGDPGRT